MSVHRSMFRASLRRPEFVSVKTEEASITNETLVDVYLGADQSIAAGTWETLALDTKNKDELGEFDTGTHQFTPEETGWYFIATFAFFAVGADYDRLWVVFYDDTASTVVLKHYDTASGTASKAVAVCGVKKLTAGDNYIVRVENADSDDSLYSGSENTFLTIRRMFR